MNSLFDLYTDDIFPRLLLRKYNKVTSRPLIKKNVSTL